MSNFVLEFDITSESVVYTLFCGDVKYLDSTGNEPIDKLHNIVCAVSVRVQNTPP
jgi:hypothetical protein